MPYRISINRLLLLTVLSYGIYLYYWIYLTWRQYRDHTGHRVFPGWHTLAVGVPIYGLFRIHGHMVSYNQLMLRSGLRPAINPMFALALILVSMILSLAAVVVYILSIFHSGTLSASEPPGADAVLMKIVLDVLTIGAAVTFLTYVQPKLNMYWESLPQANPAKGTLGTTEMICAGIGVLAWASAVLSLVVAS